MNAEGPPRGHDTGLRARRGRHARRRRRGLGVCAGGFVRRSEWRHLDGESTKQLARSLAVWKFGGRRARRRGAASRRAGVAVVGLMMMMSYSCEPPRRAKEPEAHKTGPVGDPVPSGRVRTRALSGENHAGNPWAYPRGKRAWGGVIWRHRSGVPVAWRFCFVFMPVGRHGKLN